jgi:UrcA family protein
MNRIAIAAFSLTLLAAPAFAADEPVEPYDFTIDLSGADTREGAERIYADIRRQAVRVCGGVQSGPVSRKVRECRAEVAENAVEAVNAPLVTALWQDDSLRFAQR